MPVTTTLKDAPTRVLLVDDHPMLADALAHHIDRAGDMNIVAVVGSGTEAIDRFDELAPDVAIIDYLLPDIDGVDVIRKLLGTEPTCRFLLLSGHTNPEVVGRAVEAGAAGVLNKHLTGRQVVDKIRETATGRLVFDDETIRHATERLARLESDPTPPRRLLSPRERQVLNFVANGSNTAGIAEELFITQQTVRTHVERIFSKLGVSSRPAAVKKALDLGELEI